MRSQELLTELFNRPYPVRVFYDQAIARDSKGREIFIEFTRTPSWETAKVTFARGESGFDLTGAGDEMRVFATVVAAIREWAARHQPGMIYFSVENSDLNRRAQLYQRMVRALVPGTNYRQVTRQDASQINDEAVSYWVEKLGTRFPEDTFFFLVRRDLLEPVTEDTGTDTPARQWINKIYDRFYEHPFNPRHRVMTWGQGDDQQLAIFELATVFGKPTTVDIKWFQAYPQRQGIGRRAMQRLQQLAQEDGITLTLYPWNRGEISQSKLAKIYWGMGFRPSARGSKDMTWQPQQQSVAEGSLNEFAISDNGAGDDYSLFNYAKMWYNGDLKTQKQVEKALQKIGLDIGENEDENGGAYISDMSGDYYESWTAEDFKQGVSEGLNSLPSYLRGESRFVRSAYKTLIKYGFVPDDEDERTAQMGSFKHVKGHMAEITWEGNIELFVKQPNSKYKRLYLDDATEMPQVAVQLKLAPVSTEQGVSEGKYDSTTFRIPRRKLNVPALIKAGAIFVTYPHGEQGWETDSKEAWAYSLISLYNVMSGGWAAEAKKYLKPQSYKHAEQSINSSAPNLGSNQLVYDGKYNQILWSIKKLDLADDVAFLDARGLAESLDQPYPITWISMLGGVNDAVATLPDGSSLRIVFNEGGSDDWEVDFMRNGRHDVTGAGDAQRVFATVMRAISQFIKKQDPWMLTFSADKEGYSDADKQSRVRLYDRMVKRYAQAWGYETRQQELSDKVVYELNRAGEGLDEGDVIRNKFAIKQAQKARTPYRRNPDIEIPEYDPARGAVYHAALATGQPETFSHFEVQERSPDVSRIIGVTQDGKRIVVSTTTAELARVLADAYNRGGFTDVDVQRVPLGDLDEGWQKWAGAAAIAGALGAGGSAVYDRVNTKPVRLTYPNAPQTQQTPLVTGSPHERFLTRVARNAGLGGAELAQFLAQLAHETGNFKHVDERGRDFSRYEPRFQRDRQTGRMVNINAKARALGNKQAGDGERFRGRGYIQLTGRYNYQRAGEALGMDLENNPELAAKPAVAARIALWYWRNRVASAVQDFTDTAAVTRRINPAMRGLDDRAAKFDQYQRVHAAPARRTNEGSAKSRDFFTGSKFTDNDGNLYDVQQIISFAEKNPRYFRQDFPLSKLRHDLMWWQGDRDRMMNADTRYPLLVIKNDDGSLNVADGLNRMKKAISVEKKNTIDVYVLPIKDIVQFAEKQDIDENFADGKVKGKSRPGRVKRAGASCQGSVTDLRARAKKYGGERGKMYHWCANMKSGRKK